MENTNIVTIDLGVRAYDIYIGPGLLYRFADFVPEEIEGRNFFIVADKNVEQYATTISNVLTEQKADRVETLSLVGGEQLKTYENVDKITDWMLSNRISRDSIVVAVGGGVIGDITGFCASIVMRGVPYIQVPTTLLAQVDSSVGGKTGINTNRGKNLVGSFYQPIAVIADIDTLKTLPRRELIAGYAEIVKYGLIRDSAFFAKLVKDGADVCGLDEIALSYAIEESTKAKALVVEADEQERGQRALLNLGHTFGHALETAAGYDGRLLHGEAVAIGIMMALDLSVRMGICERDDMERVEAHFIDIGLPTTASAIQPALNTTVDELMDIMSRDKKVEKGKMKFIVVNAIGDAFVEDNVPEKLVRQVLLDSIVSDTSGGTSKKKEAARKSVMKSFGNSKARGLWKSVFSSHSQ